MVSAQGTSTAARTIPRPKNERLMIRAMIIPMTNSAITEANARVPVTRRALRQRESLRKISR